MLNAIQGEKSMHIAIHRVKLYALFYIGSEALCSLL